MTVRCAERASISSLLALRELSHQLDDGLVGFECFGSEAGHLLRMSFSENDSPRPTTPVRKP
jgi:hypothetical protein